MLDAAQHAFAAGDVASGTPIVERALVVAREASVDLREIVSGIEPDALRDLGLAAAVGELAERHSVRRGVTFELDLAAGDELGDGAQSGLYQIVRDALDQAVRRGPPTTVTVTIRPRRRWRRAADRRQRRSGAARGRARRAGRPRRRAQRHVLERDGPDRHVDHGQAAAVGSATLERRRQPSAGDRLQPVVRATSPAARSERCARSRTHRRARRSRSHPRGRRS